MWENQTTKYLEICGPEPSVSDWNDLRRWDKWGAWHRKFSKFFPGSNGALDESGRVIYHKPLLSQKFLSSYKSFRSQRLQTRIKYAGNTKGRIYSSKIRIK